MLRLLHMLFRESPRTVALAVATSIASAGLTTALVAMINASIVLRHSPLGALGIFLAVCAATLGTRLLAQTLLVRLAQDTVCELRVRLSRRILAVPLRQLEAMGGGAVLAVLVDDISAIAFAMPGLATVCANAAIVFACVVYLGALSLRGLGFVLTILALSAGLYAVILVRARAALRQTRAASDDLFKGFRALVEGAKDLKRHAGRRDWFVDQALATGARRVRDHGTRANTLLGLGESLGSVLLFLSVGLVLFVAPRAQLMSADVVGIFCLTLLYMLSPLYAIDSQLPALSRAQIALGRVDALGLSVDGTAAEPHAASMPPVLSDWQSIEMRGVTHTYFRENDDSRFVLGPIDLALRPGSIVFLIGSNGSGKSTFAKLLSGLYPPEKGEIRIGGQRIDDANREWYRQHFASIFTDFYLFDDLRALGVPDAAERAQRYLVRLKLDQKVRIVDERFTSVDLSSGQRKRLALVCAYLEDRPVYVFDEWAADQDPLFKNIFYTELLPELKERGKTVFVISHDDRYFQIADEIVKLDDGKLVDESTSSFLWRISS